MVSFGYTTTLGWLAFLSLLPLIVLYFIRPKPRELSLPTIIFLERYKGQQKFGSFLKQFIQDWLLLLQILAAAILSLFFIGPYLTLANTSFADTTVLVIDTSMSMNVGERFQKAQEHALNNIGKNNVIIGVGSQPQIILERGTKNDAKQIIKALEPRDTGSAISDAITLAKKYVKTEQDIVIVISDFLDSYEENTENALESIKKLGVPVHVIDVRDEETKEKGNIGIIEVTPLEKETEIKIKNYDHAQQTHTLTIEGEDTGYKKQDTLTLPSGETEAYTFPTNPGRTTITLATQDDLARDNTAYIINNVETEARVLLLTNKENAYLNAALTASSAITLDHEDYPSIPRKEYDVIILTNIDPAIPVPQALKDLVKGGTALIIHAQEESKGIAYGDLLPFTIEGVLGRSELRVEETNTFTENIYFGRIDNYFETSKDKGHAIITAHNTNDSIISIMPYGDGQVFYYGILEDSSNFKTNPDYPIFWTRVIEHLSGKGSIGTSNIQTGTLKKYEKDIPITTPQESYTARHVLFEDAGFYKINNALYAANPENERESDVHGTEHKTERNALAAYKTEENKEVQKPLEPYVLLGAIALLFIEFVLTREKRRDYYV